VPTAAAESPASKHTPWDRWSQHIPDGWLGDWTTADGARWTFDDGRLDIVCAGKHCRFEIRSLENRMSCWTDDDTALYFCRVSGPSLLPSTFELEIECYTADCPLVALGGQGTQVRLSRARQPGEPLGPGGGIMR
jgi:hypothetical protein